MGTHTRFVVWLLCQEPPIAMIAVRFWREGRSFVMEVPKNACLRDVQKDLCSLFGQRFPKMLAKVTVLDDEFDMFHDTPFAGTDGDNVEATVSFEENVSDPYFYDLADRRMPKAQQIEWEIEVENGSTSLDFPEWLRQRRAPVKPKVDVALVPPWLAAA